MDEIDCLLEMKGHYIAVDNASIHTAEEIDELITRRGYRSIYLTSYSQSLTQSRSFGQ